MSTLYPYKGYFPLVDPNTFLAPGARVIGDVTLAEGVSIWYNVVVRGDVNHIAIGKWSNIQDNTTVHADSGRSGLNARSGIPTIIGDNVTVGHNCILHACTIEDCCLIGMGAVILDGAYIGRGSVIGAGALVLKGTVIPPVSVVVGSPAKVIKTLDEGSLAERLDHTQHYHHLAMENKASLGL